MWPPRFWGSKKTPKTGGGRGQPGAGETGSPSFVSIHASAGEQGEINGWLQTHRSCPGDNCSEQGSTGVTQGPLCFYWMSSSPWHPYSFSFTHLQCHAESEGETQVLVHTETVFSYLPCSVWPASSMCPCSVRWRRGQRGPWGTEMLTCVMHPSTLTLGAGPWWMELLPGFQFISLSLSVFCPSGKTMGEGLRRGRCSHYRWKSQGRHHRCPTLK